MGRTDPSMLGTSKHPRTELDHYVTPDRTVNSLISIIQDDLPAFPIWEPFCGTGAFSNLLAPLAREVVSTDIQAYDGFVPDDIVDFFKVIPRAQHAEMAKTMLPADLLQYKTLDDIGALKGTVPDVIISNPPYDRAEDCIRHGLNLMEEEKGDLIFLLRNEFDCAKGRRDLFRHPAFRAKITLLHRPRWVAGSTGAPRHNYSYFWWAWSKLPAIKPEVFYAD